jgi:predicted metal-binding protein
MTTWLDPGRCSTCKYCSMDLDMDPFCTHPKVLEIHRYGVNLNKAISNFCGEDLNLREEKEKEA